VIHIKTRDDLKTFLKSKMRKGQRVVLDGGAPFPGLVHTSALVATVEEHDTLYALFQLTFLGAPFGKVSAQLLDDKLILNDLQ
jgi:hypothetical protein